MEKRDAKKEFITAFWKLYEKKSIEKISVRELCLAAGYNRTTFYAHYDNIYHLLEEAVEELFTPLKTAIESAEDIGALLQGRAVEAIFSSYFPQRLKYMELLMKGDHYFLLSDKIKACILSILKTRARMNEKDMAEARLAVTYHISAVMGVLRSWFMSGKRISEKDILQTVFNISARGVFPFMKEKAEKYGF